MFCLFVVLLQEILSKQQTHSKTISEYNYPSYKYPKGLSKEEPKAIPEVF